jgi:hypothetical protein
MPLSTITTNSIADDAITVPKVTDQILTNRNLIINGAMQVTQRGTSFANPSDDTYSLDRMHIFNSNDGATTITQDTTVPSGEGFTQSIKFDCTTLDGTIAAGQYLTFNQRIEGYNNAVLGYGASGAKSITVSFYAKSNLTGTFCYSVRNGAINRAYIKEFSLTSANTWERISFTIPGETSGTWLTTNGIGSIHQISLSMGSTYHGTANQWNSSNVVATSNQVNFLSSTDNEFFLTGWQVELGDTATPFEHRSFGDELARCQRYHQKIDLYTSNGGVANSWYYQNVNFLTEMRAAPTLPKTSTYGSDTGNAGMVQSGSTVSGLRISSSTPTQAIVYGMNTNLWQTLNGRLHFDAEL